MRSSKNNSLKGLILALVCTALVGCAHTGAPDSGGRNDPLEPFNRSVSIINEDLDRAFIKPVSQVYAKVVPRKLRKAIGNFFQNLGEPTTIVNDVLQGKLAQAGNDTARFIVNSTIGLLGFLDVASKWGLEHHEEDFGQTFQVWGIGSGPYLVLPLFGSSTLTDSVGLVPAMLYTDPTDAIDDDGIRFGLLGLRIVNFRAQALGASKIMEMQLDPYVFRREAYLQRREQLVRDGEPQAEPQGMDDWDF